MAFNTNFYETRPGNVIKRFSGEL